MKYAVLFIIAALICTFVSGLSYQHGHETRCAVLWLAAIAFLLVPFVPTFKLQTVKG